MKNSNFTYLYQEEQQSLTDFFNDDEYNLCLLVSNRGQGKFTLLNNVLKRFSNQKSLFSRMDENKDAFIAGIVKSLTNYIIENKNLVGDQWQNFLDFSPATLDPLTQFDDRLTPLLQPKRNQLDSASDIRAILHRSVSELFFLCNEYLPHHINWLITPIEKANLTSLSLAKDIISHSRNRTIKVAMIIDTENEDIHSIFSELTSIKHKTIYLDPLTPKECEAFLSQANPNSSKLVRDEICQLSKGNLLSLTTLSHQLELNPSKIDSQKMNLCIDEAIKTLPGGKNLLATAALLGSRFTASDLSNLCPISSTALSRGLSELEKFHIISFNEGYFHWESYQQRIDTINSLTTPQQRFLNDKIAAYFFDQKSADPSPADWQVIANHALNGSGPSSIKLTRENQLVIYANASEDASSVGEFKRIYDYTSKGVSLLHEADWITHRDLAMKICKLGAKASYIVDDFERMRNLTDLILSNTEKGTDDYYDAYQILVEGYTTKNELGSAIENAIVALDSLGIKFPRKVGIIRTAWIAARFILKLKKIDLQNALPSANPNALRMGRFFSYLAFAAYAKSENLSVYAVTRALIFSLKNGLFPETLFALEFWATGIIAGYFKNLTAAVKWHNQVKCIHSVPVKTYESRMMFLYNAFIGYHVCPLEDNVAALSRDVEACLNDGVITFASYAAHVQCFHELDTDTPISSIAVKIDNHIHNIKGYSHQNPDLWIKIIRQLIDDLSQSSYPDTFLEGPYFSLSHDLKGENLANNKAAIFIAHHYNTVIHMLTGNWENAAPSVYKSYRKMKYVRGTYGEILAYFANLSFLAYKAKNKRLSLIDRGRVSATGALFSHLTKQKSIVAREKHEAIKSLVDYCKGRSPGFDKVRAIAIALRDSKRYADTIIYCRLFFELLEHKEKHVLLDIAFSTAKQWNAPAIENGLSRKISLHANETFYTNPLECNINSIKHISSALSIIETEMSENDKYLSIAKELSSLIGAKDFQWISAKGDKFRTYCESAMNSHIQAAFKHNQILVVDTPNTDNESSIVVPIQSFQPNQSSYERYCSYIFHIEKSHALPPPVLDSIKQICSALANNIRHTRDQANLASELVFRDKIIEEAVEGILITNSDGRICKINDRFVELLGIDESLPSITMASILKSFSEDPKTEEILNYFARGQLDNHNTTTRINGKDLFISLKKRDRNLYYLLLEVIDNTFTQEQIRNAERKAMIVSEAVRKFEDPLNMLLGYSELSLEEKNDNQPQSYYAKIINSSLLSLSDLFSDSIVVSDIWQDLYPTARHIFDLKSAYEQAKEALEKELVVKEITLEFRQTTVGRILLNSDKNKLSQALRHLISFMMSPPACKKITINSFTHLTDLHIHLKSEYSSQTLLQQYGDKNTELSWYIFQSALEQIDGKVSKSTSKAGERHYTLTLPKSVYVDKTSRATHNPTPISDAVPTGIRVLAIDDDLESCEHLTQLLKSHRVDYVFLHNADSAQAHLINDTDFDLVISNLWIEQVSGFDFLASVKNRLQDKRASFALLTEDISESISRRCSEEQIYYLSKPVNESTLLELLKTSYISSIRITSVVDAKNKLQQAVKDQNYTACELCLRHIAKNSDSIAAETIAKQMLRDIERNSISSAFWRNLSDFIEVLNDFAGESK